MTRHADIRDAASQAITVSSTLRTSADQVWRHAVSPVGINREFRPVLRMTFPPSMVDLTADWRVGERRCRSWLLLLGVLPCEYDDITLLEVEPGRRFKERSTMLTQRVWEHERIIDADAHGCRLIDRVRFVPRWRWLTPITAALVTAVFRHRHRNLRRLFGGT